MFCRVDNFDLTKLAIFRLLQIWRCALNWFTMKLVHEPKFGICHLYGLGTTYLKHVCLLIPMCKCFAIDLKIYMALKRNISQTFTLGILSWTCAGGWKSTWKARTCDIVASNWRASQKITKFWFQDLWADSSRYIACLLNEDNILSVGDDVSEGLIQKPTLLNRCPSRQLLTFLF